MISTLLLIPASILGLLGPIPVAHADTYPGLTEYTRRIIERVRQAETYIQGPATQTGTTLSWTSSSTGLDWVDVHMSGTFSTKDIPGSRTTQENQLPRITACLYGDVLVIEREMNEVRKKGRDAIDTQKGRTVLRYNQLYSFLKDRRDQLLQGAMKPGYVDSGWNALYEFDYGEDLRRQIANERMCPFSTRYFDVNIDRVYGCTPDKIDQVIQMLQTTQQKGEFNTTITALRAERDALNDFIDTLSGGSASSSSSTSSAPPRLEGCMDEWPPQLWAWSPGRFQEVPGQSFLSMRELLWYIELLRPPFSSDANTSILWAIGKALVAPLIDREARDYSARQTQYDATARAGVAAARGIEEAFSPFTKTVGKFSRLASQDLPQFLKNYAYFLRRSCMNRNCNTLLEQLMKFSDASECFPYTSGGAEGRKPEDVLKDCVDAVNKKN